MTAQRSTWVQKDGSSNGVTPLGARLAQASMFAHDGSGALAARPGVCWDGQGAVVSGTATTGTMTYSIRAAAFATLIGALSSKGLAVGVLDGATTVTTTAAPGSGSRTDRIWVRQHTISTDGGSDTDTILEFGCASGAAIPSGAMEIATANMVTGTTHTSTLTITQTHGWAIMNGGAIPVRSQTERDALTAFDGLKVYRLDLHSQETYNGTTWVTQTAVRYNGTAASHTVGTSAFPVTDWSTAAYNKGDITYSSGIFTVQTAGIYRWDATVSWPSASASYRVEQYVLINGSQDTGGLQSFQFANGYGSQPVTNGFLVQLAAGDTVQLALIGSTAGIAGVQPIAFALARVA